MKISMFVGMVFCLLAYNTSSFAMRKRTQEMVRKSVAALAAVNIVTINNTSHNENYCAYTPSCQLTGNEFFHSPRILFPLGCKASILQQFDSIIGEQRLWRECGYCDLSEDEQLLVAVRGSLNLVNGCSHVLSNPVTISIHEHVASMKFVRFACGHVMCRDCAYSRIAAGYNGCPQCGLVLFNIKHQEKTDIWIIDIPRYYVESVRREKCLSLNPEVQLSYQDDCKAGRTDTFLEGTTCLDFLIDTGLAVRKSIDSLTFTCCQHTIAIHSTGNIEYYGLANEVQCPGCFKQLFNRYVSYVDRGNAAIVMTYRSLL